MPVSSSLPPAAQEWIERLQLEPHPEGGYYREVSYGNWITANQNGDHRFAYTTIYFLLTRDSPSHFHRIQADEIWFHHAGDPIDIHCIYRTAEDARRCNGSLPLRRPDPSVLPLHTEHPWASSTALQESDGERNESIRRSGTLYEIYKCVTVGCREERPPPEGGLARHDAPSLAEGKKDSGKRTTMHTSGKGEEEEAYYPPTILQFTVPRLAIFGSTLHCRGDETSTSSSTSATVKHTMKRETDLQTHGFTVVSCVVAPGFDFKDFEVFTQDALLSICPQHEKIIRQLAYETVPIS